MNQDILTYHLFPCLDFQNLLNLKLVSKGFFLNIEQYLEKKYFIKFLCSQCQRRTYFPIRRYANIKYIKFPIMTKDCYLCEY